MESINGAKGSVNEAKRLKELRATTSNDTVAEVVRVPDTDTQMVEYNGEIMGWDEY